ncbi:MAG: hypothetical protein WBF43_06800 [Methylocella sp.]
MGARADLVIDETSILQFHDRNDLLVALNTCTFGRLHKYATFIAFRNSGNDMLNFAPSTRRQRSFRKQEWTSIAIRYK